MQRYGTARASYGFRNCIQSYGNHESYNCVHRLLLNIQSAVSDLPNNTKFLNVSHNNIVTLHQGSFGHMPLILQLRIDYNNLKNIKTGAFDNLTKLEILDLSNNNISFLPKDVFRGLRNLTYLFLHQNSIDFIQVELLRPLVSLRFLNLSSNYLKSFHEIVESIQPLQRLKSLFVCSNSLTSLSHTHNLPLSLSQLFICNNRLQELHCDKNLFINVKYLDLSCNNLTSPSLQSLNLTKMIYLNMQYNKYFDIYKFIQNSSISLSNIDYSGLGLTNRSKISELCYYLKGINMTSLSLLGNEIKFLPENTLENCTVKNTVDLSRNKIKDVNCLRFMYRSEFKTLIVEHNLLKELKSCVNRAKFSNLTYISFRFNRIWSVNEHAFSYAPNLQELKLNINNIIFLKKHSFSGLKSLKSLRLDNNLIPDIYPNLFDDLTELRILNFRNNRLSVIFDNVFQRLGNLTILDLGGNKITHLENNSLYGLQSLSKLYLDGNKIQTISSDTFRSIQNTLQVLDLMANRLSFESSREYFSPFYKLNKLYDMKLQNQQPFGLIVIPYGFFKGLTSLRLLDLAQNRLTHLHANVFDELGQLVYLSLSDDCNGIQNLPDGIFKNLFSLRSLNLENICLQTLNPHVFSNLTKLRKLQLMKNALKHINIDILKNMTSLTYLDIRKSPITCTCNNEPLKQWLSQPQVHVVFPYNLSCSDNPNSYFHDFDIKVCDMKLKLQLFCVSLTIVLLFTVIPIVYGKSYWHIKYNYFLFIAWLHERWKSNKEMYKYDAFVSYNTHDEEWVYKTMLPTLESCSPSPALRLCLHHRDFQLGRDIIDNIVDSIHNSRKTVCVVSRSYLRSEWCSLEMQLASYKLFDEMRDVLVLLLLEDIPDRELSTYHRMRKVMLKKTYISWPSEQEAQKLFWAKLIKALRGSNTVEMAEGWKNNVTKHAL
ncbi:toll-like receptor 21 [Pelobates cultripes]|uniref:Toll-like receptor 21, partial n=1 Tax=Pelobates cultripes TaxID=61616 RepID=A0AAD1WQD8_PELCU|nr:toll-like receptor 21 [Pelobates cultripes]